VLEAMPDAVVVVGSDGRIEFVNAHTESLFGYARAELLGLSIDVLLPEHVRAAHAEHRVRYGADPRVRPMGAGLALDGRRCDGVEVPVDVSLSPLHTARGVLTIASIRDVSQRRRTERALDLLRRIAVAANEAPNLEDAVRAALDALCGFTGWPIGHAYVVAEDDGSLVPTDIWHTAPGTDFERFRAATMSQPLALDGFFVGRAVAERRAS
jgi:protein-histidine pros-kinase